MQPFFIQYIILIAIILALVMLAQKIRVSYPIVLVLGGLVLGLSSVFPGIIIDPELIFFIFLPPLLYDAAWHTSWKEFWKWRRVISSFAFLIVILTSCVVAVVADTLIPGFTLALGFLLGGIVSPPDAISASTIMKNVKAPKSLVSILEGESLLNDASSLIVFRFALAAVITGQFNLKQATGSFFLVIIMGILIGVAVALIIYSIHRWLPTTPSIEIILTIITPSAIYYLAEQFHFSGVLAVVSGGLLLSHNRHKMLSYLSRVQSENVWSTLGFVLNGMIFMLIGLELPYIVRELGDTSLRTAIGYGLFISLVLIITRLISTFGAAAFTRFISRYITVADPNPGWKAPIVFGWAGMRGVVSLAAALSIPLTISEGQPFPQRNLILFITFVVILVTLVGQGLTLPWVIRKVKMEDRQPLSPEQQESVILKKLKQRSLSFFEEKYGNSIANEHIRMLRSRLELELRHITRMMEYNSSGEPDPVTEYQMISIELLEVQRELLHQMNRHSEFDEDLIRKYLMFLDLEETKLREKLPEHVLPG